MIEYKINSSNLIGSGLINWKIFNDKIYVSRFTHNIIEIDLKTLKQKINTTIINNFDFLPTKDGYLAITLGNNINPSELINKTSNKTNKLELPVFSLDFFETNGNDTILRCRTNPEIYTYKHNEGLKIHPISELIKKFSSGILNVFIDNNDMFVGTYNGVLWFSKNKEHYLLKSHFLKNKKVGNILKDKEGNYWFTTTGSGLYLLPDKDVWINRSYQENPLNSAGVSTTFNDSILMYVLNNGSIQFLDVKNNKHLKSITLKETFDVECLRKINNNQIYYSQVTSHILDINNHTEIIKGMVTHVKDAMWVNADNFLFASTMGTGICNLNAWKKNTIPDFIPPLNYQVDKNSKYFEFNRSRTIAYDSLKKIIYSGQLNGLKYFTPTSNGFIYLPDSSLIQANSIVKRNNGEYWISTTTKGIVVVDNTTVKKVIKPKNLNLDFAVSNGVFDKNDYYWFSGNGKVYRYNSKTNTIDCFDKLDGLAGGLINKICIVNNIVGISTNRGLIWFNINRNFINKNIPDVFIDLIKINDKEVNHANNLDYYQNNITIKLSTNSYRSRGNFSFYFKLNNDAKWKPISSAESQINLVSLSPGKYKVQIMAKNEDGISSKIITYQLKIAKPFWQTWWFTFIAICLSLVVVVLFYKKRIEKIKTQNFIKEQKNILEIEKLKLEDALHASTLVSLKAQMNPHFIFNALNSIQDYIMLNEKKEASRYMAMFSELIRLYLDMSNEELVSLDKEIKALKLYCELENLRFDNSINVEIVSDSNIDPELIRVPALLIQPYVENCFKHGLFHKKGSKKLHIRFCNNGNAIQCQIEDNGVGRAITNKINSARNSHKSFASSATLKRLELLNARFNSAIAYEIVDLFNNNEPTGTLVKINIPYL